MKPPPQGWSRMSASVFYDDPAAAIEWLCQAFGFELQLKVEGDGGEIVHSELKLEAQTRRRPRLRVELEW
jgi:uncharacterized glyoxalase superfamily protein PhnB